jgi:hypothetical protein
VHYAVHSWCLVFLLLRHLDLSQRRRTDLLSVFAVVAPGFVAAAVDVPAPILVFQPKLALRPELFSL